MERHLPALLVQNGLGPAELIRSLSEVHHAAQQQQEAGPLSKVRRLLPSCSAVSPPSASLNSAPPVAKGVGMAGTLLLARLLQLNGGFSSAHRCLAGAAARAQSGGMERDQRALREFPLGSLSANEALSRVISTAAEPASSPAAAFRASHARTEYSIADAARGSLLAQRAAAGKLWMPQAQRATRGHDSSPMQIRARSETTQETECSSTIRTGGGEKKTPPLTQSCVDSASREVEERLAHLDFLWYL